LLACGILIGIIVHSSSHQSKGRIIGYVLTSRGGLVTDEQLEYVTHVNFAFLRPSANGDGSLRPFTSGKELRQLVAAAHAKGKKVLISVGGYYDNGDDSDFEILATNPSSRLAFAKNLKEFMNQFDLDGIDVDWEYPEADDKYFELILDIRNAIGKDKLLTAAVGGDGTSGGGVTQKAIDLMDFVNIMSYDHIEATGHSTYDFAQKSLEYWSNKTIDRSKLNLGIPFYSRPGEFSYNDLHRECPADSDICVFRGTTQFYNGRSTLQSKIELIQSMGGGGIMIWELSKDVPASSNDSLLRFIAEQL